MEMKFEVITSAERLGALANEMLNAPEVGVDIETTSLDPRLGKIRIMSLTLPSNTYVIDLFQTGTMGSITEALHNPNAEVGAGRPLILGQNLKFEQRWFLEHGGMHLWPLFDTYRASAIAYNGLNYAHNLGAIYEREGIRAAMKSEGLGASDWSGSLTAAQHAYAAEDTYTMPFLKPLLREQLREKNLLRTALIEFGAILPEAEMQHNGFALDAKMWEELYHSNRRKRRINADILLGQLPHPDGLMCLPGMQTDFNLGSVPQLKRSLHRHGALVPDTASDTLALFAADYPVVDQVLKYRKYATRCNMFSLEYLAKNIHPVTGRIHTSYYPFTGCGRYASSKPNLQQIPRAAKFRQCFRPGEGYVLVGCDYSQIEIRLMAQAAGSKVLIDLFARGGDPHRLTASLILGIPFDKVTKEQRQMAKPVNFGFLYGMGAKRFVIYALSDYGMVFSLQQAYAFRERFFKAYPAIGRWHRARLNEDAPNGLSHTITGRLRHLSPDAYSEYFNTPIQGSGADGLKRALRFVYQRLRRYDPRDIKMVHNIHDEILLEVRDDPDVICAAQRDLEMGMHEGMRGILTDVSCEADSAFGPTWNDAKG